MHTVPDRNKFFSIPNSTLHFISFVFITGMIGFGDALMSYLAPNIIESFVQNSFVMGLVFSTSSLIGYMTDIILGGMVKELTSLRYLAIGLVFAILFPLLLKFIPTSYVSLIFAMGIWGIYYEFIGFSKSNYVHQVLQHDMHDVGWAVLNASMSLTYLLAPSVCGMLLNQHKDLPLQTVVGIQSLAVLSLIVFAIMFKQPRIAHVSNRKTDFFTVIRSWKILYPKLWPILFFSFSLTLVDSVFWTIGAILVEKMRPTYNYSSLLFVAYLLYVAKNLWGSAPRMNAV